MISENVRELAKGGSVIRAMFEEGRRLKAIHGEKNVFDFSIGNPSAEPPAELNAIINKILSGYSSGMVHGYMNNAGYEDVRAKIAESVNKENNTSYTAENFVMTCGAAGAITIILRTIINPGDEVIILAPCFGEYFNYLNLAGASPVIVPCDKETFVPDLDRLEKSITGKTKAVIINSPNNPSGVIYSEQTIKAMAGVLEKKQREYGQPIYFISDEPYRKIIFGTAFVPYLPRYFKNTFVVYSYSKSLSLPGERIGYITVPPEMDDYADIMNGLNLCTRIMGFVNAPSLFQRVAGECVDMSVDMSVYEKNLNVLYDGLTKIGYEILKPNGTFYMFPKTPVAADVQFCAAAKKYNILVTAGTAFKMPGHFRLAFCTDYDSCANSLNGFEKLYKEVKG